MTWIPVSRDPWKTWHCGPARLTVKTHDKELKETFTWKELLKKSGGRLNMFIKQFLASSNEVLVD